MERRGYGGREEGTGEGRSAPPGLKPRLLIVNADDFGISEGVNRAVAEAHQRGILTSTTLMSNMPAFDHGIELSKEHPGLGVGVHLNLTTGSPILPPSLVPSLVGGNRRLQPAARQLRLLSTRRIDLHQAEAELSAQVERAMRAGLSPTHLDSHHHLHIHPALQPMVVRIALRYGIRGIRCTVELNPTEAFREAGMLLNRRPAQEIPHSSPVAQSSPLPPRETPRARYAKTAMLTILGGLLRLRARRAGLVAPDHFRGLVLGMAFSTTELQALLERLPDGTTELMCHPGYPDGELRRQTSYVDGRDRELRALLDTAGAGLLERRGVRLCSYSDLSR